MSDAAAVEADPEPYTSEEIEEAAQAMPEMHAGAVKDTDWLRRSS